MLNSSGKRDWRGKRLNVSSGAFWKSLDDSYFPRSPATLLHSKYKEMMGLGNGEDSERGKRVTADSSTDQPAEEQKVLPKKRGRKRKKDSHQLKKFKKLKLSSNILLGCCVQAAFDNTDEIISSQAEIDTAIEQITSYIDYYESNNALAMQQLTGRISAEVLDFAQRDALQATFLKYEIHKLESKQLAESVVSVRTCENSTFEYDIFFDSALGVFPMHFDKEQLIILSKYRKGIFHTSPYDAAIASAKKFGSESGRELPPVKAIPNLLDAEMVNRRIDFTLYGFCHHCKEVQDIRRFAKCSKNNNSFIVRLFIGEHKKGTRALSLSQNKDPKLRCDRMYCFNCIFFNYDQDPNEAKANPNWICPHCQVHNSITLESMLLHTLSATRPTFKAQHNVHLAILVRSEVVCKEAKSTRRRSASADREPGEGDGQREREVVRSECGQWGDDGSGEYGVRKSGVLR